ncbi:MAG: hypothetical protein ACLTDX_12755 [[Clostridium] innocuum]
MKNFDERQEQVRGRIMTRAFLITIILMLLAAFLNDMHLYDFEKNVGFGETLISIVCIDITYGSVASILSNSYFASDDGWQNAPARLPVYRSGCHSNCFEYIRCYMRGTIAAAEYHQFGYDSQYHHMSVDSQS